MSYRLLTFGRLKDRAANLRRIDCVWPCQHTKILITSIPIKMYYHICVPQTKFGRHIVFALFLLIIIILLLSFFLSSAKSLSDTFLDDYWMEINETSQESQLKHYE
jgi:hypothetical protein